MQLTFLVFCYILNNSKLSNSKQKFTYTESYQLELPLMEFKYYYRTGSHNNSYELSTKTGIYCYFAFSKIGQ